MLGRSGKDGAGPLPAQPGGVQAAAQRARADGDLTLGLQVARQQGHRPVRRRVAERERVLGEFVEQSGGREFRKGGRRAQTRRFGEHRGRIVPTAALPPPGRTST